MQELALEAVAAGVAVAGVAGDRMADRGEVGADLVRAAGLEARLDQGVGGQRLEHREVGARRRARRGRAPTRFSGARWSRPSGASIVPERERGRPSTRAR